MSYTSFNNAFFDFIQQSPTSYHCIKTLSKKLLQEGFLQLHENKRWQLEGDSGYFVIRDGGAMVIFTTASNFSDAENNSSIAFLGAHTDSPGLKIKPRPQKRSAEVETIGVEVYGGPILSTWFDRDLAIAGRINWLDTSNTLHTSLFNSKRPVVYIPNVAIHLNRNVNKGEEVNVQNNMPLLFTDAGAEDSNQFIQWLVKVLKEEHPTIEKILSYDLFCYDPAPPQYVGKNQEFFSCPRLDNLASTYVGAMASIDAFQSNTASFVVLNDHEEIGSTSLSGADGSFALDIFKRIFPNFETRQILKSNSLFISMDNAHATHPNYADKSDPTHPIHLNHGVVIKNNSKLRYATNSVVSAEFKLLCQSAGEPYQEFVMRSDMLCGSTIGPLTSSLFGISTIDIGIPSLGMHSIRELAGSKDIHSLYTIIRQFVSGGNE